MKITHICLCGPVTDNWSYQDNLLPKYHKKMGLDVSIITSQYIWNESGKIIKDIRKMYINENNVKVIRISNKFNTNINSKFKLYSELYKKIEDENPEIIFIHGVQFLDLIQIVKYAKNKKINIYVDNHADFSNSAKNFLSRIFLHQIIWKYNAQLIEPYVKKFYGVLPSRVDFLKNVYNIPAEKVELLVMGADDDLVKKTKKNFDLKNKKSKYNLNNSDFVIVTGGKIDKSKAQIFDLIKAVQQCGINDVELIIFGSIAEELKQEFFDLIKDDKNIQYVGWLNNEETYEIIELSSLVIFPGRHSVLWEQTVGMGKPIVVKYWEGTEHIDVGGNVEFLYENSYNEIKKIIEELYNNENKFKFMKEVAADKGMDRFSYYNISKKSIAEEIG